MPTDWNVATNPEIHALWDVYRRRVMADPKSRHDAATLEAIEAEIKKRNPGFYDD